MAKVITIRQGREYPFLFISGISTKQYKFDWDEKLGAYTYETVDETEIDDIALTQDPRAFYFFSFRGGTHIATPKIAPTIDPAYYNDLSHVELVGLCKDVGIKTEPKDNVIQLKRLLNSYFLGAGSK